MNDNDQPGNTQYTRPLNTVETTSEVSEAGQAIRNMQTDQTVPAAQVAHMEQEIGTARTTEMVETSSESQTHVQVLEATGSQVVVQLREEYLVPDKTWTEAGAILIRKELEEHTETLPVELQYEQVQVDRVPVNRVLGEGESAVPRQEGDTLIIPVVEEEAVIIKRLVVREELRVTKVRATRQQQMSGTVKRERLNIETTGQVEPSNRTQGDTQQ